MGKTDQRDEGLNAFFDAARDHGAVPDSRLQARLMQQALAAQPMAAGLKEPARPARSSWLSALGGWPAVTGLATATLAGVWIGAAQPDAVGDIAFGGLQSEYDFSGLVAGFDLGFDDG